MNTVLTDKERVLQALLGPQFNRSHGSLFDRGSADSYYGRPREPHWYPNGTGISPKITELNAAEIAEYNAGYDDNERNGHKKDYS